MQYMDVNYLLAWSTLIMILCCDKTQIYEICECQNNDSTIAIAVLNQLPVLKHKSIGCIQVESIIICTIVSRNENIDYMHILYILNSPLPKVKYII